MTSRIAFESWQMIFPAIGLMIFAVVFAIVVVRAWLMKTSALERLNNLPLADDERVGAADCAPSPRNISHVRTE